MKGERRIAGLLCSAVLEGLSEYLEGGLSTPMRAQVVEHVRGCENCARFGGRFADTLSRMRRSLADDPIPAHILARVKGRFPA